jgi:hypothetical protein
MAHPISFKDGEFGYVAGAFLGGPFDGDRYCLPVLPDGDIPVSVSLPLNEPGRPGLFAEYARHGDEPIGGYYVYLCEGSKDSDGHLIAERSRQSTL